jgi:hypothetical protein
MLRTSNSNVTRRLKLSPCLLEWCAHGDFPGVPALCEAGNTGQEQGDINHESQ